MLYTVKKLANFSGVSIRTLHYYDEINLLKPAVISENGYRYYQEEQLLMLQQILFFKEIDFDLKQIKEILGKNDFDKKIALQTHRQILKNKIKRLQELIITIDNTVKNLERKQTMNKDIFKGFDLESEVQKNYEKYLEEYFNKKGKKASQDFKKHKEQSIINIKNWTNQDWQQTSKEFDAICIDLEKLLVKNFSPDNKDVQQIIERHFKWLSKFWTPNKESYAGHAQLIMDSDLKNAYNKYNSKLAEFLSEGIKIYADRSL